MKPLKISLILGTACLIVAGCLTAYTTSQYSNPEELISPLEKLTPAVQSFVRYPDPKHPVSDDQLLVEVYKQDAELARAFQHFQVLIRHDATNVILLICRTNKNVALLEDASWTAGVDKMHFRSNPPDPAVFTISLPGTNP
jgi:hypothetical protein